MTVAGIGLERAIAIFLVVWWLVFLMALPFGTFLAIGAAVSATVGQTILDWYFGLW